jgi:hypothetical protein
MQVIAAALSVAFVAAASAADTAAPAAAPKPTLAIVRGIIESFDGKVLKIKTSAGAEVSGVLLPQTRFAAVESRTFEQLKATDFVGITAVDGSNGHLVAEEIHILPGVMGEGQYPWDHHPDGVGGATRAGSMTNGTVAAPSLRAGSMTNGTVMSGDKHELKVTFHGSDMVNGKCVGHAPPAGAGCTGTASVDVTPKTYIQAIVPAKIDDVKAGLAAAGTSATSADGSVAFVSVVVEKNGVKPEF